MLAWGLGGGLVESVEIHIISRRSEHTNERTQQHNLAPEEGSQEAGPARGEPD